MNKITLRGTALEVTPLCLGTAQYGTGLAEDAAIAQLTHYAEHGGNFIDTAHVYGDWGGQGAALSERIIGRWLRETGNRQRMVLSTKGAHPRLDSMHSPRATPSDITADLEESLRALGVDTIDLYFLHRDDPSIPAEEMLSCLEKARAAGKIRHYGCSNWTLPRMREAELSAKQNGFAGFACNQAMWSLADINRSGIADKTLAPMTADMYRYHNETGLSAMAYTSLAHGYFMRRGARLALPDSMTALYKNDANEAIYRLMDDANDIGFGALDLSLNYLLQQPFPTVAIAAFSTTAHIDEAMQSAQKKLPSKLMAALDAIKKFAQ